MRKSSLFIPAAGTLLFCAELWLICRNISGFTILTYLLFVGILPVGILFVTSLFFGMLNCDERKAALLLPLGMAVVFALATVICSRTVITAEVIRQIVGNTDASVAERISLRPTTMEENLGTVLLYPSFACIGAFFGILIGWKKKEKGKIAAQTEKPEEKAETGEISGEAEVEEPRNPDAK